MSQPIRFGKYLLLDKIGTGGMAELFLAKQTGLSGFEKVVAIKRILPHLTESPEFITMFINEAKLAALLTHQNIVQIYDLGNVDRCHYIAMEYIMGKDFRTVINQGKSKRMPLSIGDALLIVSKICSALDYAHRKKDLNGNDLHLVHRDISPQNILISYEGEVKLVDFGIAKAATGGQETKTGVLKGKLAYMSPEQAWGKPVDGRTDLFALGIVLYEAVTGERLFSGNDEISLLEKVRRAEVPPPTDINPTVPPELEAILRKAMAKEPEDRYQTASEMEMVLEELITKKGYAFSSLSLSHYMQALFAEEILNDTRRLQLVTRQAQAAAIEDRSTIVRPSPSPPPPPADPAAAVRKAISRSKIILPPPKGERFSRWVSAALLLSSWSLFLLLLFLSEIHFVSRLRSRFPALERSKIQISSYLEGSGLLAYLDGFQTAIFRLIEPEAPASPSFAPSSNAPPSGEAPVTVTLARPEPDPAPPPPPDAAPPAEEAQPVLIPPAQDVPSLYRNAKEDYNAGRLDRVERTLWRIIEIDPNPAQAYHLLGTVYKEKKEPDRALRIFADAAALFPKEAILHYDLGFLYFDKGVDALAAQELRLAVKLSPQAPQAERAREILQKMEERSSPAPPPPEKRGRPLRAPAPPPPSLPKPESREAPAMTPPAPPLESAAIPPAAPLEVNEEEQIRLLLSNQKRGFEGKNIEGVLQGYLHPLPDFRQEVGDWFQRFDRVSVNYEVYELKIEEKEASVTLLQNIVLHSDKNDARQVEKALVFWKLAKSDDGWKIAKVNVIEEY